MTEMSIVSMAFDKMGLLVLGLDCSDHSQLYSGLMSPDKNSKSTYLKSTLKISEKLKNFN